MVLNKKIVHINFHIYFSTDFLSFCYIMHSYLQIYKKSQMQMALNDMQKTHNILITDNMTSDTGV